ncbi:MAG: 50S ribosomal protein L21 [Dethiobacter sp.]|jgi:large subunit ribosomal protein L21|nr:MAG: 50S ribosomal protein L21 [Dethiobacter sp.]
MYAIIETGGKQYRVSEGSVCRVEKLPADAGTEVVFEKVLVINNEDETQVGSPYVAGAKVLGKVLSHGKGKKIIVFKFKPKKNYRRKQGHRQPFTQVIIEKIELPVG